jgi:UDP-perosamine 4-acetyltransferase
MKQEPVVLVGAGGHAKVVADILSRAGVEIAGCICPSGSNELAGVPWLGDDDALESLRTRDFTAMHIAIGDNARRRKMALSAKAAGFRLVSAISERATISTNAQIEAGVAIMPGAVVNTDTFIGECAIVNTGASVDHDCRIGAYVHIAPGCHIAGRAIVQEGAFLGVGVSVIPRMTIGSWAVVGAGAAVVQPVPEAVTAVGVPARIIRRH